MSPASGAVRLRLGALPSCRAHLGFDPLDVFISSKHRPKCFGRVHRLLERDAPHVA